MTEQEFHERKQRVQRALVQQLEALEMGTGRRVTDVAFRRYGGDGGLFSEGMSRGFMEIVIRTERLEEESGG